jgi:hypothetical protein
MIKTIGFFKQDISKHLKKILMTNNYIFLFHEHGIEIGNISDQSIFIQKYILLYENIEIFEKEKKLLISISINKYLDFRKCIEENYDKIQILKSSTYGNIGKLIVLKNNINKNLNILEKRDEITIEVKNAKKSASPFTEKRNNFNIDNNSFSSQKKTKSKNANDNPRDNENIPNDTNPNQLKKKKKKFEKKNKKI